MKETSPRMRIRVGILEDELLFADLLKDLVQAALAAEVTLNESCGVRFVEKVLNNPPDIVLIDIGLSTQMD